MKATIFRGLQNQPFTPPDQKHYIHRTVVVEFMFGSLLLPCVIHCVSRKYRWKADEVCVIEGSKCRCSAYPPHPPDSVGPPLPLLFVGSRKGPRRPRKIGMNVMKCRERARWRDRESEQERDRDIERERESE